MPNSFAKHWFGFPSDAGVWHIYASARELVLAGLGWSAGTGQRSQRLTLPEAR
jgi:hypothetical protein